jgi:exopolysaccharide biosynthesis polyprenyl glycosylphosphotransferase
MGHFISNPLWNSNVKGGPGQYARMILGGSAVPVTQQSIFYSVSTAGTHSQPITAPNATVPTATPTHHLLQTPLPQPVLDRFTVCQLVADDLIVLAAVCGASSLLSPTWGLPWTYVPVFVALVALFGFCAGLYNDIGDPLPVGMIGALARSILYAIGLIFIARWGAMQPLAALAVFACSLISLVICRGLRQAHWKRHCHEAEARRVLIVGAGPIAQSIAQVLRNDPAHRFNICGFIDDDLPLSSTPRSPMILGRIEDLDWLARAEFIDEVILAIPDQPPQMRQASEIAFRNHLDIRAVPDLPPGPWPGAGVDRIGSIPVLTLHREAVPSASLFLKRTLDIAGAIAGLILTSPLMALIALSIRLDSRGPIIYCAERAGAKGRPFRCYKFRSMVANAEYMKEELQTRNQREGPIFKLEDDPRITRVGRLIRRYSLDELPQLWNVLHGEMSLVGPRPHPVDEVNHYELQHYRRLDVKPGITGLWQITARNCPSFDLNMHLDLTYIENWSLRLDLRILASTVRVLFAPEGA